MNGPTLSIRHSDERSPGGRFSLRVATCSPQPAPVLVGHRRNGVRLTTQTNDSVAVTVAGRIVAVDPIELRGRIGFRSNGHGRTEHRTHVGGVGNIR